jgi:3'-phosphoadenosine 5'-phosphosulfate (PAPS) 3'-phosphatase
MISSSDKTTYSACLGLSHHGKYMASIDICPEYKYAIYGAVDIPGNDIKYKALDARNNDSKIKDKASKTMKKITEMVDLFKFESEK